MKNIYFKFDKAKHNGRSFTLILNSKLTIDHNYKYNGYDKKSVLLYAMIEGNVKVLKLSKGQIKSILNLFPSGKLPSEGKYIILNAQVKNRMVTGFMSPRSFIDVEYKLIDITDNLLIFDKEVKTLIKNNTLNKVAEVL